MFYCLFRSLPHNTLNRYFLTIFRSFSYLPFLSFFILYYMVRTAKYTNFLNLFGSFFRLCSARSTSNVIHPCLTFILYYMKHFLKYSYFLNLFKSFFIPISFYCLSEYWVLLGALESRSFFVLANPKLLFNSHTLLLVFGNDWSEYA